MGEPSHRDGNLKFEEEAHLKFDDWDSPEVKWLLRKLLIIPFNAHEIG